MEIKNKKCLVIHCGYPKAGSSFIIENIIRLSSSNNAINVNNEANLLNCFEMIKNLSEDDFNEKIVFITDTIYSFIFGDTNFFGYERIFNINENYENKFRFFKRIIGITDNINVELKISIFFRNQPDLIASQYKENYFRIIFKNLKYISFQNYISSITNQTNIDLLKNLDFEDNVKRVCPLFPKKNIFLCTLEELLIDPDRIFHELLEFCNFKKNTSNYISIKPVNSSSDKKILNLIGIRIYDYVSFKKKFTISTVINLLELLLKFIFLQNLLNRTAKISKSERKHISEVYYLANKKLMRRFNIISNNVYEKYFYIE